VASGAAKGGAFAVSGSTEGSFQKVHFPPAAAKHESVEERAGLGAGVIYMESRTPRRALIQMDFRRGLPMLTPSFALGRRAPR
jgi:hypothetical protein